MFLLSEAKVDGAVRGLYIGVMFPGLPKFRHDAVTEWLRALVLRHQAVPRHDYIELRNSS